MVVRGRRGEAKHVLALDPKGTTRLLKFCHLEDPIGPLLAVGCSAACVDVS